MIWTLIKNFVSLQESQDNVIKIIYKNQKKKKQKTKKKKKQKKQAEKDLKRKNAGKEIKDIQKKRRFLTATIEDLIKDADKYKFDAAKKKDFQLLEWSNDVRSLVFGLGKRRWVKGIR